MAQPAAKTNAGNVLATRILSAKTRFNPTQKIIADPTAEIAERTASVIRGLSQTARAVTPPWSKPTGIAEKIHPRPSEEAIIMIITASSTDFASSIAMLPERPSSTAPTIAIAPIQTTREDETKAFKNPGSFSLPLRTLSHKPNRSIHASRPSHSQRAVPNNKQRISIKGLAHTLLPFVTVSISVANPRMPIKRTQTPVIAISDFCMATERCRPKKRPTTPPKMMAAMLINVPSPAIKLSISKKEREFSHKKNRLSSEFTAKETLKGA